MRSGWGNFPEHHSSADNLDLIRPEKLARTLHLCAAALDVLEQNRRYCNQNPFCEPQLGRRDLYRPMGGTDIGEEINARLWVLNLSDGHHSLLDIAERSGMRFSVIHDAADLLHDSGLLSLVPEGGAAGVAHGRN